MKKLPLGIASIREILNEGYAYIDKTALIYSLITRNKYYFLARPRRFGKSLLVNTLHEIFKGNKALFKGTAIYESDYSWESYPVLSLDFSHIPHRNPQSLEAALKRYLKKCAHKHAISIATPSLEESLKDLIRKLHQKTGKKIVVLIDEYDRPIRRNLANLSVAQANGNILQDLFTTLKSLGDYLRFIFITGVSKFSLASIFSGLNNLKDISMEQDYSALLGYTEKEITSYLGHHLEKAAEKLNSTPSELMEKIRLWYNGYRFSKADIRVYTPHSTLNFLDSPDPDIRYYWATSAMPEFLIHYLKQNQEDINNLSGFEVNINFFGTCGIEDLTLPSIMWEAGYLTIHSYNPETKKFLLDYPNQEVKDYFLYRLAHNWHITGT